MKRERKYTRLTSVELILCIIWIDVARSSVERWIAGLIIAIDLIGGIACGILDWVELRESRR